MACEKTAKVEALRRASTLILNSSDTEFSHLTTDEERHSALTEYIKIGERMRIRAIKLGGDYNRFTGKSNSEKKKRRK